MLRSLQKFSSTKKLIKKKTFSPFLIQRRFFFTKLKEKVKDYAKNLMGKAAEKLVTNAFRNKIMEEGELADLVMFDITKLLVQSKDFENYFGELREPIIPPLEEEIYIYTKQDKDISNKLIKFSILVNSEFESNLKVEILAEEIKEGKIEFQKIEIFKYDANKQPNFTFEVDLLKANENENIIDSNFIEK